jgi:hypothetical protein
VFPDRQDQPAPQGPKAGRNAKELPPRARLFGDVHSQIDRIDRELGLQLKRMAQIQQEIDDLRRKLRELAAHQPDSER